MSVTIDPATLTRFFIAILLLLTSAHAFGYLCSKISIPRVVGEIAGGLVLGPSCLGYFFPAVFEDVFLRQGELLSAIYWLGLVLLMFCSGFEIEREFEPGDRRTIVGLVCGTTFVPLIFGWASTYLFDLKLLIGPADHVLALRMVITIALAVTSIPVLSKIFMDLGIMRTRFAKIVLATATIHDLILWVFLSIATGLVTARSLSAVRLTGHVLVTVLFFVAAFVFIPRLIQFAERLPFRLIPRNNEAAVIVVALLLFTVVASLTDVNLVFGAFLAGIVVNFIKGPGYEEAKRHTKSFSTAFFIPIYFSVVGLKLDLIRHLSPVFCVAFLLFALAVQTFAVLLTARLLKYRWMSSFNLAVALNDRGGPCIVLATVVFDLGIISEEFFVTLILLAIVTSLTAGSWFKYALKRRWMPDLVLEK